MITRATDMQNLLALVRKDPGRPANHYAVRLNLPHNYTRKLLVQLEQEGELDSKRVRVYRAALQRSGEREQRQSYPQNDQPHAHPAARPHQGHQGEDRRHLDLIHPKVHPAPLVPIRDQRDVHDHCNRIKDGQREIPLGLLGRETHSSCPITDDQGAHAETPEGRQ